MAELEDQLLRLTRERSAAAVALREAEARARAWPRRSAIWRRTSTRELVAQADDLNGAEGPQAEAELAALGAEVRHQDSVFATLEVLKKEQDFLRELIGSMIDEGGVARDRVEELRQESASLVAQQLELEKELIGKQAEIDVLDKAIVAKSESLDAERGVSSARAF